LSTPSSADRLREIERIIAQTSYAVTSNQGAEDSVAVHLADVPTARIRELTRILQQRPLDGNDDIDALAMRLLLNDYIAALAHLRAVARAAASLVDGAAVPVKQSQRFLRRDDRRHEKHAAEAAPPGEDDQLA
jgi:hypothetical protein